MEANKPVEIARAMNGQKQMTPDWLGVHHVGNATFYLGDCTKLSLRPQDKIIAIISDPPYGIGAKTDHARSRRSKVLQTHDWQPIQGDDRCFDALP